VEDERRRQVKRVYHSVLEISPDQRDAFLKRECPEGLGTARPWESRQIGIGAAVARRPLPHHRAYGSVHGGSRWLR